MTDTKLGPEEIAELKAKEAKATPGPWEVYPMAGNGGAYLAEVTHHAVGDPEAPDTRLGEVGLADAALIVLLRNHAPALIAAAERCGSLAIELQEVKRVDLEQMEWMSDRINELDRRNDEQDRHRRKALADVYTLTTDRDALAAKLAEVEGRKAMATAPCTHATTVHVFSVGEDAPGKSLDTISQCTVCGAVVHDYRHGGGMTSPNYPIVTESPLTVPFRQLAQQLIEAERDRDALARKVGELEAEVRAAYDRGLADGKGPNWQQGYYNLADGVLALTKERDAFARKVGELEASNADVSEVFAGTMLDMRAKLKAETGGHPWERFLKARMRALQWLRDEMGETPEQSARTMSMDPGQVRLLLLTADEATLTPPAGEPASAASHTHRTHRDAAYAKLRDTFVEYMKWQPDADGSTFADWVADEIPPAGEEPGR